MRLVRFSTGKSDMHVWLRVGQRHGSTFVAYELAGINQRIAGEDWIEPSDVDSWIAETELFDQGKAMRWRSAGGTFALRMMRRKRNGTIAELATFRIRIEAVEDYARVQFGWCELNTGSLLAYLKRRRRQMGISEVQ